MHQYPWSYVKRDLQILQEGYDVVEYHFTGIAGLMKFSILKNIWSLWRLTEQCDLTFAWFGSLHAFFTVLFSKIQRKPSIVVAGGWDVGQYPDGLTYQKLKRWCPQYVFTHADLILPVSDFTELEMQQNIHGIFRKVQRIYHGFDLERYHPINGVKKEPIVITVGTVSDYYIPRKGLQLFVEAAIYLPRIQFWLIGDWIDKSIHDLQAIAPDNVHFSGRVSDSELMIFYSRAKVYVQASTHEAFGCSVAEAMLCECIPVVSQRAVLPEVVGDCCFYVDQLEPEAVAGKIKEALEAPPEMGKRARQRIVECFPLEKRRRGLLKAVTELMEK